MPDDAYARWLSLRDLAARPPMNGPIERRGLGLIDIDPKRLEERLHIYFGDASDEDVRRCCRALMENEKRKNFDPVKTRRELRGQTTFRQERMASFSFRPFDDRYLYSYRLKPLFGEPAEALFELAERDNFFLVASTGMAKSDGGAPAWFGRLPCDSDFFAGHIGHIPAWLEALEPNGARRANLSSAMRSYLTWLGFGDPDLSRDAALILWHHALAVLYAPAYQDKHAELLRHGYPRLPLPGHTDNRSPASARKILEASADLGQQIADLLEPRCHPGKPELADMAILIVDGHAADPHELRPEDLTVTANWGTLAKWGAVRPRKGVTTAHGTDQRIDSNHWRNHFEGPAVDVHLNDHAYWSGIPNAVWEYRIGGRQVLAKWLSYRQEYDPVKSDTLPILGRPLTPDEAGHFTDTARRLARLILLGRELDRSWERLRDA